MKVTLSFNEDKLSEARMAFHAQELYLAVWNIQNDIRSMLKYRGDLEFTEAQEDAIREIVFQDSEILDMMER